MCLAAILVTRLYFVGTHTRLYLLFRYFYNFCLTFSTFDFLAYLDFLFLTFLTFDIDLIGGFKLDLIGGFELARTCLLGSYALAKKEFFFFFFNTGYFFFYSLVIQIFQSSLVLLDFGDMGTFELGEIPLLKFVLNVSL